MPSPFVGIWNTFRYSANSPEQVESIQVTIGEDADPTLLDGAYPRPGQDARLHGPIEGGGTMWRARFDERESSGDEGEVVFFISTDGNTLHGAWASQQHGSGPQPWFGTRA